MGQPDWDHCPLAAPPVHVLQQRGGLWAVGCGRLSQPLGRRRQVLGQRQVRQARDPEARQTAPEQELGRGVAGSGRRDGPAVGLGPPGRVRVPRQERTQQGLGMREGWHMG